MGEVNVAVMGFEQATETFTPTKESGSLQGAGKEYAVLPGGGPEAEAIQELFDQTELPERLEYLNDTGCEFEAEWISPESLFIQQETEKLLEELQNLNPSLAEENAEAHNASQAKQTSKEQRAASSENESSATQRESANASLKKEAQSIFSLSRMMGASQGKTIFTETKSSREMKDSFQSKVAVQQQPKQTIIENLHTNREEHDSQKDREQKDKDREQKDKDSSDQEDEGFGGSQQQQQQREKEENLRRFKKKAAITEGVKSENKTVVEEPLPVPPPVEKTQKPLEGMSCIFVRFMALMARILSQAEADAHDLYQRIKARTDDIDTLTLLISKINSVKGDIDWTKDEEMKKLVEKVRAMGVDIPKDKLKWKEDEKKLLKENIQMRKDNLEKVTQLERTDMQRYLQEASQCHQARSNVLKLLKEVTDTIIHNMRPS